MQNDIVPPIGTQPASRRALKNLRLPNQKAETKAQPSEATPAAAAKSSKLAWWRKMPKKHKLIISGAFVLTLLLAGAGVLFWPHKKPQPVSHAALKVEAPKPEPPKITTVP